MIDRGWLPIGNNNPGQPGLRPGAAAGPVTAVVRLKHGEPELQRGAPDGQLASIDLPAYAAQLRLPPADRRLRPAGLGDARSVADMPFPFPKPSTEEGTHLSYSLQWFAFGVLMFVGFGYAARQQARNAAIDAEDEDEADGPRTGELLHSSGRGSPPSSPAPAETEERHGRGRGRRDPGRPGLLSEEP